MPAHLGGGGTCDAAGLNGKVVATLQGIGPELASHDGRSVPSASLAREDCHWLPQWMYVDDGSVENGMCETVLHYEDMQAGFAQLMGSYDDPLTRLNLDTIHPQQHSVCAK